MELFHALMNGSTLLVTDINADRLLADESFRIVMHKRHFFLTSEESVKMKVSPCGKFVTRNQFLVGAFLKKSRL